MKNVIFLLVDCFDYNKIGTNEYRQSPTPFLDSLKKRSYWCEKMYSEAPYTEAALIATMCGYDTLENGGYLMRYKNCPENLFEMFQKGGYEVYAQMWPHFDPKSALRGIDVLELRPYSFHTLWMYRFEYYAGLYDEGNLEEQDYIDLEYILKENLEYWCTYLKLLMKSDPAVRIILENSTPFDYGYDLKIVMEELEKFNVSPKRYIKNFLSQKKNHVLYTLHHDECLDRKVSENVRRTVAERYKKLNKRLYETNNRMNRRNNKPDVKVMCDYFRRSDHPWDLRRRTNFSQYLRNYIRITHYPELKECISEEYHRRKDWLSTDKMVDYFLEWEASRREDGKPYFAYLHTEDIHGQPTIFDICSEDERKIHRQLKRVYDYLNNLPHNYVGNLGYDLGLLHVDNAIEKFVHTLEEKGIFDNSVLVITSDHGCGTNYYPLRGYIQNFHDECYHVPFIMLGGGIKPYINCDLHETKDIMATLGEVCGLEVPPSSSGISVFSTEKRNVLIQEYMGPGCPDMFRRPAWMCAFDDYWKVFVTVPLVGEVFDCTIEEIYDLKNDRLEVRNLARSESARRHVGKLVRLLERRWEVIRSNYSREGHYER